MTTVNDLITKKPLLPVVEITKNDASTYTYNPFTSTFDFYVRSLSVTPAYDSLGGTFTMTLTSSDATNANANTLITNIDEGNEVLIYIGKDNSSKTKLFRGVVESWEINEANKNFMDLQISGPDFGSDVLKNRVVTGQWTQLKSNLDVLDNTDPAVTIKQIVTDLLTLESNYPSADVTAEDQGIVVTGSNLLGDDLRVANFNANYEFLDDKLQELDGMLGTIHYVDPDKNFIMKAPTDDLGNITGTASNILLTDSNTDSTAIAATGSSLGLIEPGITIKRTLENHKRRVFGLGGNKDTVDQSSETDSGNTTLDSTNYAMSFTPEYISLSKVHLLISKIGTPTLDFQMEIRESGSTGLPTGEVLRTVSKNKAFLNGSGTTAVWSPFEVNVELNTSKTYWIVVRKGAGDSGNCFRWHHDNTDNNPSLSASSSDDVTWAKTTTPNRFDYGFRTWNSIETLIPLALNGQVVSTDKHLHEDVIRKADITDQQTLLKLLITEAGTMFKKKEILSCSVYAPDTLIQAGQTVRIRLQASGYTVDTDYVIGGVDYTFQADEEMVTGTFSYNIEAVRYITIS